MILLLMPPYQVLDAPNYLVQRIDEIILNYYMELFERLEVILLFFEHVLMAHIAQT